MKELSIEQKAKAYDEALKFATIYHKQGNEDMKTMMETCFPELKESEDKEIGKEIADYFKHYSGGDNISVKFPEWIAWLKKQGEHANFLSKIQVGDRVTRNEAGVLVNLSQLERVAKPRRDKTTDKVEPKFKKGDYVLVSTTNGDRVVQIASVEYFKDGYPSYITTEGRWFGNGTKARLLADKDVEIAIIPKSKVVVSNIKSWSEEDENMLKSIIATCELAEQDRDSSPAKHLLEMQTNWLKSLKDRVQPQPKQEWSEKDENEVAVLEAYIRSKDWSESHIDRALGIVDELVNKVKSLRP